ncbi:sulfatase [Clostridiales bacterium COT073_COT-073]|nr:sulfatase [Clostridiales bacterium COT073_COT-073]
MKQKNLIYIFADQWRASALGYANEDPVITPNMDSFCRESVYCSHTFSTFPLCSPHRASLLTGKYPLSAGFFTNCKTGLHMRLQDEEIGIAQVLKAAGYQTGYIGKWHLDEPELNHSSFPCSGAENWDAFTPPGIRRHGFDFWYSYGAWDKHLHPHYWQDSPEKINIDQWSPEHETDVAIDYLTRAGINNPAPFALFISWNPPHSPYDQVPEKYLKLYEGNIPLRANVCWENLQHHTEEKIDWTKEELIQATKEYYAAISGLDEQFGRLIQYLKEIGRYEDTIIILSSDHGDMMGSHGLMGKHVWYEESIRIPYIIHYPGCQPRVCKTCMGSQDMMPTMLGMLNLPTPDTVEGVDCHSIILNGQDDEEKMSFLCACPGREVYLQEFQNAGKDPKDYGWRGVRTQNYTYVVDAGYHVDFYCQRYLYDHKKDPWQTSPLDLELLENKEIAANLEDKISIWLERQKDTFVLYPEMKRR